MEKPPEDTLDPEVIFRHLLSKRVKQWFSLADIEADWKEFTGEQPPEYLSDSLENLVEQKVLAKRRDGMYLELPF